MCKHFIYLHWISYVVDLYIFLYKTADLICQNKNPDVKCGFDVYSVCSSEKPWKITIKPNEWPIFWNHIQKHFDVFVFNWSEI